MERDKWFFFYISKVKIKTNLNEFDGIFGLHGTSNNGIRGSDIAKTWLAGVLPQLIGQSSHKIFCMRIHPLIRLKSISRSVFWIPSWLSQNWEKVTWRSVYQGKWVLYCRLASFTFQSFKFVMSVTVRHLGEDGSLGNSNQKTFSGFQISSPSKEKQSHRLWNFSHNGRMP